MADVADLDVGGNACGALGMKIAAKPQLATTETLDLLSDAEAMADIRQADADVAAGRVSTLDEVEAEMRALGRLPE